MSMASSPSRPRLTVAMIVKNEQAQLPAVLAGLGELADELVIVDTGSTDQSRQVALQHGAKWIDHAWNDDFSAARNAALAAASGDWIFWIDACERLAADQAKALRAWVDQADPGKAWLMYIEVPPAQASGAVERVARIRLMPRFDGLKFAGRVRETARASILAAGLTLEMAPITIRRTPAEHRPEIKRSRARRDLRLLDRALPEQGPQAGLLNALGECHATLGNPAAAARYYQQALRVASPGSTELLETYYGLLTTFDDAQHDRRLATCLEALDRFPFDAQLLCAMGNYLQSQNNVELSCRAYQSAVQLGQVNPELWHIAEVGEVAAICLAATWQLAEQDDRALKELQEAAARMPDSARIRRSLIELHVKHGRLLEALGEAERLPSTFPFREAYRSAIRGGCQAARKNWVPATAYLETAYNAGCRDALCLRWLMLCLMNGERLVEAEQLAVEWRALEPNSSEVPPYVAALKERLPAPTRPTQSAPAQPAPDAAATAAAAAAAASGMRLRVDQPQDPRDSRPAQPKSVDAPSIGRPRG